MRLAGQDGDARSSQRTGAAAVSGRRPRLLRNSRRRPLLPLTTLSRAVGITDLKASRHGGFPAAPPPPAHRSSLGSLVPLPPPFMPIKQPIGPILHGGQCTAQHVEEHTAERTSKACLWKTRVHAWPASVDSCSPAVNTADAHANN